MSELLVKDYFYELPEELIAQDPLEDRSSSRLMVVDKESGEVENHIFKDIVDMIEPEDTELRLLLPFLKSVSSQHLSSVVFLK